MILDTVAIRLIGFYQRRLSASIFFYRRRCSFSQDSCSEFGMKAVRDHGAIRGVLLIRQRLRRCREFNLFAYDGKYYGVGSDILGWSEGYDRLYDNLQNLHVAVERLRELREAAHTIGQILQGLQLVHVYRTDAVSKEITAEITRRGLTGVVAVIRNSTGFDNEKLQKRLARDSLIAGLAALLIFIDPVFAVLSLFYLTFRLAAHLRQKRFYTDFIELGRIRDERELAYVTAIGEI